MLIPAGNSSAICSWSKSTPILKKILAFEDGKGTLPDCPKIKSFWKNFKKYITNLILKSYEMANKCRRLPKNHKCKGLP